MTDWQGLLDGLTPMLAALPEPSVLQIVEAARPDEGRYVQVRRRARVLRIEAVGQTPLADEDLPIRDDRLSAAGWSAPTDPHPFTWWLELEVEPPAEPQAFARLAFRCVAALNQGFGIGSPAQLAYRAWRDGSTPLVYPELGIPSIDVLYYARLSSRSDTADDPSGLLRRLLIGDDVVDQAYGRDLRWLPTRTLAEIERGASVDRLMPITGVAALEIVHTWRELARSAGETEQVQRPDPSTQPGGLRWAQEPTGGRDAQGNPVMPPGRLDETERGPVVRYLREAPVLATAFGFDPDPYQPGEPEVIPLHIHTDGEWVWPESLAYFAEQYGFAPEPELLEHMRRRRYQRPDLPKDARIRLSRQLRGEPA